MRKVFFLQVLPTHVVKQCAPAAGPVGSGRAAAAAVAGGGPAEEEWRSRALAAEAVQDALTAELIDLRDLLQAEGLGLDEVEVAELRQQVRRERCS